MSYQSKPHPGTVECRKTAPKPQPGFPTTTARWNGSPTEYAGSTGSPGRLGTFQAQVSSDTFPKPAGKHSPHRVQSLGMESRVDRARIGLRAPLAPLTGIWLGMKRDLGEENPIFRKAVMHRSARQLVFTTR